MKRRWMRGALPGVYHYVHAPHNGVLATVNRLDSQNAGGICRWEVLGQPGSFLRKADAQVAVERMVARALGDE